MLTSQYSRPEILNTNHLVSLIAYQLWCSTTITLLYICIYFADNVNQVKEDQGDEKEEDAAYRCNMLHDNVPVQGFPTERHKLQAKLQRIALLIVFSEF